jgi:hypothetical protein
LDLEGRNTQKIVQKSNGTFFFVGVMCLNTPAYEKGRAVKFERRRDQGAGKTIKVNQG